MLGSLKFSATILEILLIYCLPVSVICLFKARRTMGESAGEKTQFPLQSKRRSGFDISRDILRVCVDSATKTRIVSAANLNNKRINRYLEFLLFMKLLARKSDGRNVVYFTTPDGEHFLRTYFRSRR